MFLCKKGPGGGHGQANPGRGHFRTWGSAPLPLLLVPLAPGAQKQPFSGKFCPNCDPNRPPPPKGCRPITQGLFPLGLVKSNMFHEPICGRTGGRRKHPLQSFLPKISRGSVLDRVDAFPPFSHSRPSIHSWDCTMLWLHTSRPWAGC